jgi:hypothetical protein
MQCRSECEKHVSIWEKCIDEKEGNAEAKEAFANLRRQVVCYLECFLYPSSCPPSAFPDVCLCLKPNQHSRPRLPVLRYLIKWGRQVTKQFLGIEGYMSESEPTT